jgi:hypothetical protein
VILEAFFKQVCLDEQGIYFTGIFGNVAILWENIESVTYNHWLKVFAVRARDGEQLRINPFFFWNINF